MSASDWERINSRDFQLRFPSEVECIRANLPSRIVRSPSRGMPDSVFVSLIDESLFCLGWIDGDDSEPTHVGYVSITSEKGLVLQDQSTPNFDREGPIVNVLIFGKDLKWGAFSRTSSDSAKNDRDKKSLAELISVVNGEYEGKADQPTRHRKPEQRLFDKEYENFRNYFSRRIVNYSLPKLKATGCDDVVVNRTELSFYIGFSLYEIIDRRGKLSLRGYLVAPTEPELEHTGSPVCCLNGGNDSIYKFNSELGDNFLIDDSTAADYLIHFCRFLHAELGAFQVVESSSNLRWLTRMDEAARSKRKDVQAGIENALILRPKEGELVVEQGAFDCSAFISYGRTISYSRLRIYRTLKNGVFGMIEMMEDKECFSDLPIVPFVLNSEADLIFRSDNSYG